SPQIGMRIVGRQAERLGRMVGNIPGNAPAIVRRVVAASDASVLHHAVEPHVQLRTDRLVDVDRASASGVSETAFDIDMCEVDGLRTLRRDVEGASGRATSAKEDAGPRRISTCSASKFSRMLTPGSRTPSTKTSLRASKPRMKNRSPKAL